MNRSTVLAVISAAVAVMMFVPAAYSATTSTSVESQDNVIGISPVPVETVIDANGGSSVIRPSTCCSYKASTALISFSRSTVKSIRSICG